ncbi:tetratricopeptide repeat protein [Streptomyces sp. ME02-8801-2C]|uniref:tetratricopeptide repeat protein n=1 Tax=Streptomyces sp. ME02-8801-2C TaxID=3028680 RepID=UPI0029BCDFC8|nr:tetratricopeptide repeat protein [Streptomyces sp. ME02-8801-2C]MDX3452311.1 tetratricopeptide repeat protein [Streptomyces sp. ME02-8801-2C]
MALSAVGTVASGALSGAGGEMGRRTSERLCGLLGRARTEDGGAGAGSGGGEEQPTLPVTEQEQRAAALRLVEVARRSPEAAREVAEWVREASWLAPRAVPAVAHGASRPQMLPPATAVFTDRQDVIAWITALLDDADPLPGAPTIAALTGPGGIGKTAFAVHCAYALRERFPDGILFVDLAGASSGTALPPSDVLARFLERLGVPPAMVPGDEARQRDLFRDCTADRRMMVVLDNAHSDAQVVPLLPASPGCLVLVTSRHRLGRLVAEHGARPRVLGPLSTADSVLLLRRVAGSERAAAPDAVVQAVAEAAGGVPLALCTTGAGLAVREHLAWERVARELSERIHGQSGGGDAMRSGSADDSGGFIDPVRRAQDASYRELTPECAAFYRAIAGWAWPTVTVMCAAHAAGVEEDQARELLEQLARVHLLEEVGEERYRFHDLARAHARELAVTEDGHGRMSAGVRRVVVGYLRWAAEADFRVMPLRWRLGPAYRALVLPADRDPADGRHALAQLRSERENLAAAIRAADHHGFDDLVWQLCEAMWGLHLLLGFHAQWIDTHLLGVEAARRCAEEFGDRRAVGRMLVQLAFGHMGAGRADDAEQALAKAGVADEACGHHRGQASAVEALGLLRLKRWKYADAQRCFEEAREILGRIREGDDGWADLPRATALLEHHIGRALTKQRQFAEALARLNDALVRFRQLPDGGDAYNEGRVYMSLGEAHLEAGDTDLARVCLDKAVKAMETAGAGLQLADVFESRARCHRLSDRQAEAADDLRAAAAHYEGNGDRVGAERIRMGLAEPEA